MHCFLKKNLFVQKYFQTYRKVASKKNTYILFTQIYLAFYPNCLIFLLFAIDIASIFF